MRELSGRKNTVTVRWKKQAAKMSKSVITGYQVQYSTSSAFTKSKKTVKVKGYKKTAKTIKNLSPKKRYYFRIRTYKIVKGEAYYSSWSKAASIRTA